MTECLISFPGPVSKATVSLLIIDYLKYILYYRGQFPLPLDQLKKSWINSKEFDATSVKDLKVGGHNVYYDLSNNRKDSSSLYSKSSIAVNRTKQNFMDSISKFDNIFNELLKIMETQNVLEIVLNLGPNIMSPKEMYRITLPVQCTRLECNTDYAEFQKCKLKFFRDIMHSNLWADLKVDNLLPISILLLLENGVALKENMEQKHFYTFPRSCKQRIVCFSNKCTHVGENSLDLDSLAISDTSASKCILNKGLWVKLKPDLKGFKSYSESRSRSCSAFV